MTWIQTIIHITDCFAVICVYVHIAGTWIIVFVFMHFYWCFIVIAFDVVIFDIVVFTIWIVRGVKVGAKGFSYYYTLLQIHKIQFFKYMVTENIQSGQRCTWQCDFFKCIANLFLFIFLFYFIFFYSIFVDYFQFVVFMLFC